MQSDTFDLTRLLDAAHIHPLLKSEILWLSRHNIDIQSASMYILFVVGVMVVFLIKALAPKATAINTSAFALDVLYLFIKGFATIIVLAIIPFLMQERRATNYPEYLNVVKQNIVRMNHQLTYTEKRVLSYCIQDSTKHKSAFLNHNAGNSGERFDRCVLRFAFIQNNHGQKTEFDKFNQVESMNMANEIADLVGRFPEDQNDDLLHCTKEAKQAINKQVNHLLNKEAVNKVMKTIPTK